MIEKKKGRRWLRRSCTEGRGYAGEKHHPGQGRSSICEKADRKKGMMSKINEKKNRKEAAASGGRPTKYLDHGFLGSRSGLSFRWGESKETK